MKNKTTPLMLLYIVFGLCIFVGFLLVAYSWSIVEFTDEKAAMEWFWISSPTDLNREAYAEFNENWHRRMDEFRTHKWPLYDSGVSVASFGGLFLLTLQISKLRSVYSLSQIQTPKRKITLIVLGVIGFAFMVSDMVHEIVVHSIRYEVPHWADTASIPLCGISMFAKDGLAFIVVLGFVQIYFLNLPAQLFKRHLKSLWWSLILWAPYGLLVLAFSVEILIAIIVGGFLAIPGLMIWIYVVLSTRAGLDLRLSERK